MSGLPGRRSLAAWRRVLVAAAAAVALAAPTAAAQFELSLADGKAAAKRAVKAEFSPDSLAPLRCQRTTALKVRCAAHWRGGVRRYRATVVVSRSGIPTSPVDRYSIDARSGGKYLDSRRERRRGRVIVQTRVARFGEPLRLLGYDEQELELVVEPLTDNWPAPEYDPPAEGARYMAARVTTRNVGPERISRSLSAARLITAQRTKINAEYLSNCDGQVDAAPGEARVVCVGFEVPYGTAIVQLEFPGGRETGVWR